VEDIDIEELRERILSRFVAAWPQRDVTVEAIDASLEVAVELDADGEPKLVVRLLGYAPEYGFDGSHEDAIRTADAMAANLAENAEGDRWTDGEGWKEYRS
jgi:hypothetical protein